MSLVTKVLVSDVTNLSDARYCAGMGVDWLGFNLEPGHPGAISQSAFKEICGWVAGVQTVGQFSQFSPFQINQLAAENDLDFVQLNRHFDLAEVEQIRHKVIMRVNLDDHPNLAELKDLLVAYEPEVEYFLLDSDTFGLHEELVPVVRDLALLHPVLLGFGVTVPNLNAILNRIRPAGLRLYGGAEVRPGYRDFDELAELLELLESPE